MYYNYYSLCFFIVNSADGVVPTVSVQESPGVPERDEAAAGHVPLSTQRAEGQSATNGCREEI